MADYNIYIHSVTTESNSNKTTPWGSKTDGSGGDFQTTPQGSKTSSVGNLIKKIATVAQNPDSLAANGISSLAKSIPYVAVAMAILKVCDSVINEAVYFVSTETGMYNSQVTLENIKTGMGNLTKPFSTVMNHIKEDRKIIRQNERLELQRSLFGDSYINSITGKGV